MTRRSEVLDAIEPIATASLCGADMDGLGLAAGDVITVKSRRGEVAIHVRRYSFHLPTMRQRLT